MSARKSQPARSQPVKAAQGNTKVTTTSSVQWAGPLPPPGALRDFNEIIPDGAQRIMSMVEAEQNHRITHEKKQLNVDSINLIGGKLVGAALTIGAGLGAAWCVKQGNTVVAVAFISFPVLTLIGRFLTVRLRYKSDSSK